MWRAELTRSLTWNGVALPELGVEDIVGLGFFGFASGGGLSETEERAFVLEGEGRRLW